MLRRHADSWMLVYCVLKISGRGPTWATSSRCWLGRKESPWPRWQDQQYALTCWKLKLTEPRRPMQAVQVKKKKASGAHSSTTKSFARPEDNILRLRLRSQYAKRPWDLGLVKHGCPGVGGGCCQGLVLFAFCYYCDVGRCTYFFVMYCIWLLLLPESTHGLVIGWIRVATTAPQH